LSLCVGVGIDYNSLEPIVATIDVSTPAAPVVGGQDAGTPNSHGSFNSVSCPSVSFCVAAGEDYNAGRAFVATIDTSDPTSVSVATSTEAGIPVATYLSGVSCPSVSFCVAAGWDYKSAGFGIVSTIDVANPVAPLVSSLVETSSDIAYLNGVSCPAVALCVAVGGNYSNPVPSYAIATIPANTVSVTSIAPVGAVAATGSYTPAATALSGPVTVSIDASSTSNCSISAGVVTWSSAGTCVVDFASATSGGYVAASAQQSFTILPNPNPPTTNTVSVTSSAPVGAVTATGSYAPVATALSGFVTVTIDASSTSNCSISSGVVTWSSAGTCVVDFASATSQGYVAATLRQSFVIGNPAVTTRVRPVTQHINFGAHQSTLTVADQVALQSLADQIVFYHLKVVIVTLSATAHQRAGAHGVVAQRLSAVLRYLHHRVHGSVNYRVVRHVRSIASSQSDPAATRSITVRAQMG
jgi:hypothetical protein